MYNLPLQINLQPPTQGQLNGLKKQIESALSGVNVGAIDTKNFAKTNAAIQQTGKQLDRTGEKAEKFWDVLEGKTRSAVAYTVISTALMKVTGAVSQATREAIKYEEELLKISQVTGDSVKLTNQYSRSLLDISKKYNVTLSKVALLTRTLTQTGLSFREAAKGAEVLARTSLLATFDSLTSTTEGLIAVMQTFEVSVNRAGKVLESINAVSKAFAVESSDIVEAIRRTGGAFSTAGGSIEELIALFTAVRSTSRESAETIATGFRTIFGRLQRPKTIEYFKQLGIQLETAEGQFIGPYQAIEQISRGLKELGIVAGTTKFAEVVEQIGGIRQISRVVPLLEQASKSQRALGIANRGTADSVEDVEKAQQGLGYQLGALQKEFGALISDIVNSPSFKFIAEVFINTSKAVIRLVSSLKPLLPLLASVAAFKIGRGLSSLLSGGFSLKGAKESLGFASGGIVPGSGNGDTVPAMLTPGEFVIRKSAVQAYGADRLAKINKYAKGGEVLKAEKVSIIDGDSVGITYASDPYYTSTRLLDVDAYELNKGTPEEKRLAQQAKEITASHYSGKSNLLPLFQGQGQDKYGRPLFKDSQLANKLLKAGVAVPYRGSGSRATKMANGGSVGVGTDTVPALLTPGEYVINKKSAEAFGYGNLQEINRYAKGGKVGKAERTLSKEERKRLLEESKAEQSADGLTRSGRREAGQLARGMDQADFIAVQEKWTAYIEEETKNAKEVYQAKVKQIQEEGGSVKEMLAVIQEYKGVVQNIQSEAKGYQRKEEEAISAKNITEAQSQVKQKEADAKEASQPAKMITEASKTLAQKIKDGGNLVYSSLAKLNMSYAEAIIQTNNIASALKNFGGLNINQEALIQGQVKGGVLAGASETVGQYADPKAIQEFGSQLNRVGKMLPKSIGGPVRQFGGLLLKNGANIAKFAGMAAKGLNALSFIELGGGLVDALFSTDYSKQRDNLIALGDAAGAATAAARAYSQEQYRAIPIIGGFLTAMGFGSNATEDDLDATGKLVVANARLEASINGVDREVNKAKDAFKQAQALGDTAKQQEAFTQQLDIADSLRKSAEASENQIQALQSSGTNTNAALGGFGGALAGAGAGAAAGAAIGSIIPGIGTAIGAGVGALTGAIAGGVYFYSQAKLAKEQIIKGYELQGEALKKAAEIQVEGIQYFSSVLNTAVIKAVQDGGTYADALAKVTEQFGGKEAIQRLLGGQQLTGNAKTDIEMATKEADRLSTLITARERELGLIQDSEEELKAKKQAEIDELTARQKVATEVKNAIVGAETARIKEAELTRQREIEAKAMAYQIALLKEMESAYDGFNATMRDARNIAEEAANIGTNKLTTPQAAEMSGVKDSRIYEMSAGEIIRNEDVTNQMAARVGINTMRGQELLKGQSRVKTIDRIQSELADTGELAKIRGNLQPGEKADAEQIKDAIYERLQIVPEADPILDKEIEQYAQTIANEGVTAAAKAGAAAREGATQQSKAIIEEQQRIDKELFDAQKQLRDMQIELVQKQMANAQQAYDNEKDYFNKRSALANKVEDVLSPIEEGPGRAAAMATRGAARAGAARDALGSRRRKQFGEVGLGGQSLGQAVNSVSSGFEAAGEASEELKGQMEALMNTIQDEIEIEQDYLDTLIEVAKAQQEYTQSLNDAQGSLVRDLVTGTEEDVGNQLMALNAAAVAAQQGSFAGIPEELKKDVFALFDQFGDIEIPGLGMTGRDAQREITKNELMRNFGYDEQTATKLASKAVKDKVPIDERMADQIKEQEKKVLDLLNYEKQLKDAQLAQERENTALFAQKVEEFAAAVNKMVAQAGNPVAETPMQTGLNMAGNAALQGVAGGAVTGAALGGTGLLGANTAVGAGLGAAAGAVAGAAPGLMFAADAVTGGGASRAMNALGGFAQNAAGALFGGMATDPNAPPVRLPGARPIPEDVQARLDAATAKKDRARANTMQAKKEADEAAQFSWTNWTGERGITQDNNWRAAMDSELKALDEYRAVRNEADAYAAGTAGLNQNTQNTQGPNQQNTPVQTPGGASAAPTNTQAGLSGPQQQQGPIQVQTQGQQEITIRLPDIQGLVNQQITALVYETVGNKFNQVASDVRSAQNFDDVANALSGGISETTTQNV